MRRAILNITLRLMLTAQTGCFATPVYIYMCSGVKENRSSGKSVLFFLGVASFKRFETIGQDLDADTLWPQVFSKPPYYNVYVHDILN